MEASHNLQIENDNCKIKMSLLCCCQTAPKELDELCYLTAQSMTSLVTSQHFKLIKKLGEGSYGKVMLAVHQRRGQLICAHLFGSGLALD